MRAKLVVTEVKEHLSGQGLPTPITCDGAVVMATPARVVLSESVKFRAVCKSDGYGEDGMDENNTFAKFSPTADLSINICNPNLFGKLNEGDQFYVDFTKAN